MSEPATKKELDALQKEVNELRRWFQDEKKWTLAFFEHFAKLTRSFGEQFQFRFGLGQMHRERPTRLPRQINGRSKQLRMDAVWRVRAETEKRDEG